MTATNPVTSMAATQILVTLPKTHVASPLSTSTARILLSLARWSSDAQYARAICRRSDKELGRVLAARYEFEGRLQPSRNLVPCPSGGNSHGPCSYRDE